MFLKLLKIENGSNVIREIPFKKGLNLIIDETKTANLQESGNNVGKTSVLRLIDYCLGSDGINVYKDTEFKEKSNTLIENFLKDNNIIVTLILKKDIEDINSPEIVIRRNFLNRKDKIQEINGEYYNERDFDSKLKQLVFNSSTEKPTFRQIISKNIRYEKFRLDNTIKVLHYGATFEQYEALYFFWLGIETDTASLKQKLYSSKSTEDAILKRLKKDGSLSEVKQALSVIERDIEELNKRKSKFSINESYEQDLGSLNQTRANINSLGTAINQLDIRKEIIEESKFELEKEFSNIDLPQLEYLYKSAQSFVPNLHVKFTEMLSFHNNMLKEKIKFISSELPSIEKELLRLRKLLRIQVELETKYVENLKKTGAIDELEDLISKLNLKFEQKGRYEQQQKQWENSLNKIEDIEKELHEINAGIANQDKTIENQINKFNKFFSKISEKLYDEQFILSPDKNARAYDLKISSIGGNLGTGKKKGQIAAFDIAYILFADDCDLSCLHFILHDQIENIHDNQLKLLADVVNLSNVQFVVPVLRDKLPSDINIKDHAIISLSQDEKLFKIK